MKNKGYHLFADNFYTSPTLAQHLHESEVMLTGSLRPNRKGVPVIIRQAKPKVQECVYARKGPLLVLTWKEKKSQKKPCLMLSTGVSAEMVDHRRASGEVKQLPKVISLYNHYMGGVDLLDQKVDQYAGERGFHKYWKKCFFGIIDRMVVCSYILYNQNTSDTPKLSRFHFMCKLVEELCDTHVGDDLIPQHIPSEHRIIQLPREERVRLRCLFRQISPRGKKTKSHTVCKMQCGCACQML